MRKIVLPLIETDRSLMALQYAKKHFAKDQAEIIIVMSDETLGMSATREEEAVALSIVERKLDVIKKVLDGYKVVTKAFVGKAGPCIVKVAREYNADYIVMTKSAREDTLSVVGKTTDYVLNNAYCNVLIISENRGNSGEYKGLIYKKAQATVNLRGQIGDKQSECLLPSVDADCNYHFEVTVGKIRFFHTAYNPETGNWDMPPSGDQTASVDIAAGETADILVKANSIDGKADRIRIINRGMKQEAVFGYKITAAVAPQPLEIPEAPGAMPAPAVISLDQEDVTNDITLEAVADAESIFDEMPAPSIYDTAEFEAVTPENVYAPGGDILEYEETVDAYEVALEDANDFEVDLDAYDSIAGEQVGELSDGIFEEIDITETPKEEESKKEFSFDWSDVKFNEEEEDASIDSTLTGFEMLVPDEDEISNIVDDLKDTITSLDDDIARREEKTMRFGMPDDDLSEDLGMNLDVDSNFDIEEFFKNTGLSRNDSGATTPAFDDIFESIPARDPIKHATTATVEHDFDEIINEFRTSQMGSVGIEFDDDSLDEY